MLETLAGLLTIDSDVVEWLSMVAAYTNNQRTATFINFHYSFFFHLEHCF